VFHLEAVESETNLLVTETETWTKPEKEKVQLKIA
jgi:hypothetical protein